MSFVNLTLTTSFQVTPSGADPISGVSTSLCVSTTPQAAEILVDLFNQHHWIELSTPEDKLHNRRSWISGFRRDNEQTQAPTFDVMSPAFIVKVREAAGQVVDPETKALTLSFA